MKNFFKVFCGMFLLLLFIAPSLFAGNGKIAGVIKDNAGKPIPGATVMIEGTRMGAAADIEGRYFILNIPPGKYNVVITAVGYKKKTVNNVPVSSDLTAELNAMLEEAAVQVEGVVVEAERKLVDKTLTSTRSTISSEELSNVLPVSSTYELLQSTPAFFRGYVRGGRIEQTKSIVEGVDVSDQFYAVAADVYTTGNNYITRQRESQMSVSSSINANSISEMTVNTGALGAEYQSAAAGIINYSLKEGRGAIGGRVYLRSGAGNLKYVGPDIYGDDNLYFTEKATLLASGDNAKIAKGNRYTYTKGMYDIGQTPMEGELSLNGSASEDLGFFFSGNFKNNPECRLPNQRFKELNTQLKLNYNLTPEVKLTAFGLLDDKGKLFGWKNSNYNEKFKYFLQGVPQTDGTSWVGSLKMTHFLSNNTFYEVQLSNKSDVSRQGYVDANGDGVVALNENGDFLTFDDTVTAHKYIDKADSPNKFFSPVPVNHNDYETSYSWPELIPWYYVGKPGLFYESISTNTFNAKADFISQVTFNHQLKAGLSYKLHNIDVDRKSSGVSYKDEKLLYNIEKYNIKPNEFAAYVSDRMEYSGLVINMGVRVDYWNPNASDIKDYWRPYINDTLYEAGGRFAERVAIRGDKINPTWFGSPRIAVSHPLSDRASIYFSFSKMFQPPPFSVLYSFYNTMNAGSWPTQPVVSRQPYKTTNYEMGGQWEFADRLALNINAYYRDIENYQTVAFTIAPSTSTKTTANYNINFSSWYADSRGIELQLEALPTNLADIVTVSGRLAYTFSYIKAATGASGSSTSRVEQTLFTGAADSAKIAGIIPFDNYKYYRKVEVNSSGSASSLTGGFDRAHRIGYTLFFRFPFEVTLTSIGTFQSGFYYASVLTTDQRAGRELLEGPWNAQVDLRLEKAFTLGNKFRVAVYADVKNLLDNKNILAYDNSSNGKILWETTGDPTGASKKSISPDNSFFYDIPREFYFGLTIDF